MDFSKWRSRSSTVNRDVMDMQGMILFSRFDRNGDGDLARDEFISGLEKLGDFIDLSIHEAGRLFDKLDPAGLGYVTVDHFLQSITEMRWLRSLAKLIVAVDMNNFPVSEQYDYSKSTTENYRTTTMEFTGDFADIRARLDYNWHSNYVPERQKWQDFAIRSCLGKTEPHARPWIIYTCGPMGVGKGHVLSWLSQRGFFPVEYIAHIDPDFFKRIMPEWRTYVSNNKEFAGTACHQESGYLQEIAQEVGMRERQHIWVDGSLSDGPWFQKIFEDIRKRFPHYRIGIIHVSASEATIRSRIAKRSAETGRSIPESQIIRSLESPENSLRLLAPLTDIVVRILNENAIILKCVEDYSGNWYRGMGRLFNDLEIEELKFPHSLGTLYLEKTSLLGRPFIGNSNEQTEANMRVRKSSNHGDADKDSILKNGYLEKQAKFYTTARRRYFVLYPDSLSYYIEANDKSLKGAYSLCGNFELLSDVEPSSIPRRSSIGEKIASNAADFMAKAVPAMKRVESRDDKHLMFCIRGFHTDGSGYSVTLKAPDIETKTEWVDAISSAIQKIRFRENSRRNSGSDKDVTQKLTPELTSFQLTKQSLVSSPNLRILSTRFNPVCIEASPLYPWTSNCSDVNFVSGAPENTTNFRFLFPSPQIQSTMLTCVTGCEDPDVLLLIFGGFAYYDANGDVIGVMAISETPSRQCLTFTAPLPLPEADAARIALTERWCALKIPHLLNSGAKYFTYIYPSEILATRKYSKNGCLAFIFREPHDPPDNRDCFFAILHDY